MSLEDITMVQDTLLYTDKRYSRSDWQGWLCSVNSVKTSQSDPRTVTITRNRLGKPSLGSSVLRYLYNNIATPKWTKCLWQNHAIKYYIRSSLSNQWWEFCDLSNAKTNSKLICRATKKNAPKERKKGHIDKRVIFKKTNTNDIALYMLALVRLANTNMIIDICVWRK